MERTLSTVYINDEKELNKIIFNLCGTITCDIPNPNMYSFDGLMCIDKKPFIDCYEEKQLADIRRSTIETVLFNLSYQNLLLRGSSLKNTDYIYGIVVNVGHFTKIMLNSLQARNKQSKLSLLMNSQLYIVILIELIICTILALLFSVNNNPYV